MSNKVPIQASGNIVEITDMESFEKVVSTINIALEDALISIERARDKNGFAIGFPINMISIAAEHTRIMDLYRSTLEKVYSGNCSLRAGLKVWPDEGKS